MKRLGLTALAIVILFGAILRLTNIDGKLYWHDEAYTSLRLSGYTQAEVYQQIFTGELLPIAALDRYQHPTPEKPGSTPSKPWRSTIPSIRRSIT
ncbi:MAG: hypothetical protein HC895_00375 [Leptolyngbyaceae cyanobacterium SM1_3_5]|nr:hypothetical protein [Leptolyngbyaceae cyanobacterium SM1_3_5]